MEESIIIGLLQNVAILLSFSMIYQNFWIKNEDSNSYTSKILTGIILGCISIVLMFTPWTLAPGISFDTRSVMLAISGLFFGPIPTIITIIIACIGRVFIGGDGLWMGLAVIISSGLIGLYWRKFRPKWKTKNYYLELLSLGLIVHITMSFCTIFLPVDKILPTLKIISIPLIIVYSPATMLLGIVMLKQYTNFQNSIAQLKLKESELRFTQVLESGNIVSLLLNNDGTINFCNNYLLQITGYTQEEILGKNWFDIFIQSPLKDTLKKVFSQTINAATYYENEILTKNGELLYISWHNITLYSSSNTASGIASIGVNITGIKNHEKELKEKNEELIKAKDLAEENNRLKSAFLANISHEIRTPMNSILGFSDLLKNPNLTGDKQKKFINIIEESGKRMLNLISDIINISKIESGIMEINISEVNINDEIENIYALFKDEVEKKGTHFSFNNDLPYNNAYILTDNIKIYAILTNLIKNAIKFTTQGFIKFGYKVKKESIVFYVKDSGIGISKEQQKLIFERFRQGSESLNRNYDGAGLGLAIAKAYIEILGGKIWVESELTKGTTFYFSIDYNTSKTTT
ncbi:LytS/YhcK type 5TM receptor domain-containing protein [uncultured Lutibacter sp.]|uniref:LytS/YhcK type 5TM receptor domain-containing protein n=1 Tax=uncultured Lutibacter sp. TaxID=437739 RepID=UPI00260E8F44|nr:LytS/YhcK type 5TM receptor domain-containing protein [uncultured Lutibacter sp.]